MANERPTSGVTNLPAELTGTAWHEPLARVQRVALMAGVVGLVLCIGGLLLDAQRFYAAYLVAFLFWFGISLGSLVWVMIYHLTGGNWGLVTRRLLEASGRLTPLAVLFFLPLLPGLDDLYVWAQPETVQADELLQHKQPYLNPPFFLGRTVVYFAVWALLAWQLHRWSQQQDRSQDPALVDRLRRLSGPGLAVYGLTITFAAVDWVMSLDPHWFSSIFGVLVAASEALSALAFAIIVLAWLAAYPPLSTVVTRQHFGDLGNLLLAAVLFWAYIAFAQFVIIWSGNLPEEPAQAPGPVAEGGGGNAVGGAVGSSPLAGGAGRPAGRLHLALAGPRRLGRLGRSVVGRFPLATAWRDAPAALRLVAGAGPG
jgi:hypothetical protein